MPHNTALLCYTAGLILYEVKITVDLVRLTFIENSSFSFWFAESGYAPP